MKTKHLFSFLGVILLMMPGLVFGQQKDKMVHLKVIKNDQAIVDTSFLYKDLEEKGLQEKISELAGIDITLYEGDDHHAKYSKSMSHSYVIVADGEEAGIKKVIVNKDEAKDDEHHMAFVVTEDNKSDIILKGNKIGVISKDSLKKGNVYIIKEGTDDLKWISEDSVTKVKKGDVWIIGEDEDQLIWVSEGGKDDSVKVIVRKAGDDDEVIHIHEAGKIKIMVKEDDGHMVIHTNEGEDPGEHKIIKVKKDKDDETSYMILFDADNERDEHKSDHKSVYVYTDEETNGTKFASKSVMVKTKKIEGSDDIEIIVTIEEKEKGEIEKKSPESKQKKDNDRKKM